MIYYPLRHSLRLTQIKNDKANSSLLMAVLIALSGLAINLLMFAFVLVCGFGFDLQYFSLLELACHFPLIISTIETNQFFTVCLGMCISDNRVDFCSC